MNGWYCLEAKLLCSGTYFVLGHLAEVGLQIWMSKGIGARNFTWSDTFLMP